MNKDILTTITKLVLIVGIMALVFGYIIPKILERFEEEENTNIQPERDFISPDILTYCEDQIICYQLEYSAHLGCVKDKELSDKYCKEVN